ncbi:MAG: RNA polymerase sigma factor [Bacteroidota bacterium]
MKQEKFIEIVTENQGMIHKVCRLYRDTIEDREDLFQDIVLELWKSISTFQHESKIGTWIYRIAFNTAIARYRSKSSKIRYQEISDQELNLSVKPKDYDAEDPVDLLYTAINKLNNIEKAIILLYLENLSYQEMSGILGLSESNVSVKLTRIRKKLKEFINAAENDNDRSQRHMAKSQ